MAVRLVRHRWVSVCKESVFEEGKGSGGGVIPQLGKQCTPFQNYIQQTGLFFFL